MLLFTDAAADLIFHFSDEAVRYPGLLYELPSYAPLTLSRPVAGSFRFSIDSYVRRNLDFERRPELLIADSLPLSSSRRRSPPSTWSSRTTEAPSTVRCTRIREEHN